VVLGQRGEGAQVEEQEAAISALRSVKEKQILLA
jgi:hypothetical protein